LDPNDIKIGLVQDIFKECNTFQKQFSYPYKEIKKENDLEKNITVRTITKEMEKIKKKEIKI